MIEKLISYTTVIQCDECANTFTGDHDEPMDDVVKAARDRAWLVSGVPGGTLCPATRRRLAAESKVESPDPEPETGL